MPNTFFHSDPHFDHQGIITFNDKAGKRIRQFDNVEDMNELMIDRWNAVVRPQDTVYELGDVAINRRGLQHLARLNGRKILLKGNHDIFRLEEYTQYFDDIRAYKIFPEHGIICSHIPIHPYSMERWKLNLHGHLHTEIIETTDEYYNKNDDKWTRRIVPDKRYRCVSVEQTDYAPISLDDVLKTMGSSK